MPSPAMPGLFFCFACMVLLLFASVSPPAWTAVNFLSTTVGSQKNVYGVFGKCITGGGGCTKRAVCYDLNALGVNNLNSKVLHNLTCTLILHPIVGGLAFFGLICGLIGVLAASRVATVFMGLFAILGSIVGLLIFVIDMVLWNLIKNRLHNQGHQAKLGNANWLTIGGTFALLLAACSSMCGACGRFATGRMAGEKY